MTNCYGQHPEESYTPSVFSEIRQWIDNVAAKKVNDEKCITALKRHCEYCEYRFMNYDSPNERCA